MKYDLIHDDLINICKTATVSELDELCEEIRVFLVEKVSKTGGHLASNLGIVELSVALMRVFDISHMYIRSLPAEQPVLIHSDSTRVCPGSRKDERVSMTLMIRVIPALL